ncbi:hypothetical protein C8R46DRAFT_514816 [Mycena filopes]|nr:hypothetical protein C8R46DRAFT_514816 [Mycena filopes]
MNLRSCTHRLLLAYLAMASAASRFGEYTYSKTVPAFASRWQSHGRDPTLQDARDEVAQTPELAEKKARRVRLGLDTQTQRWPDSLVVHDHRATTKGPQRKGRPNPQYQCLFRVRRLSARRRRCSETHIALNCVRSHRHHGGVCLVSLPHFNADSSGQRRNVP